MAYEFNGTTQYLSTASTPITNGPLTVACWYKTDNAATSQALVSIGDNNGQERFQLFYSGTTAVNPSFSCIYSTGSSAGAASNAGAATTNTWYHVAGTVSGALGGSIDFRSYRNGVLGTTLGPTTTSALTGNIDSILIGARFGTSLGLYLDGQIAEVGIWNAALTAAEIAALAKGMTCDKIRPQSLVFYAPLVRDLQDVRGGLTITNNNAATVATHPRVYA
jgi:hypothetical protein